MIMENVLFETNRIIIRRLSINDSELLFKYSQEEITKKELPDEVFDSIIETKETIKIFKSNYDDKYPLVYGIILRKNKIIIGHIGLSEIDKGIEIGYAVATEYQNNGYISEIIIPFVNWVKNNLRIEKIYGIARKENIASWKILEKNSFELEEEVVSKNYFEGKYEVKIYSKTI
jgi:[ribosomal protein S5]-alanine N-acetyltransferase